MAQSENRNAAFMAAENAGRWKFAQLIRIYNENPTEKLNYHFTNEQFYKVDAVSNDNTKAFEIKNRDIHPGKYLKQGYLLEKNKYDELMKYDEGYYVNFFNHNSVLIWEVHNITKPLNWYRKWCTETTVEGYGKKVKKLVCDLKVEDAIVVQDNKLVHNRRDWAADMVDRWQTSQEREEEERLKEEERQRSYEQKAQEDEMKIRIARELMASI